LNRLKNLGLFGERELEWRLGLVEFKMNEIENIAKCESGRNYRQTTREEEEFRVGVTAIRTNERKEG
jgi:hypothetical protein